MTNGRRVAAFLNFPNDDGQDIAECAVMLAVIW
jgi:hypothetical protein